MPMLKSQKLSLSLCLLALSWFAGSVAQAQLSVTFEPSKKVYIAHESILGKVTVRNLTGTDIVLDGERRDGWLSFNVNFGGRMIPRSANAKTAGPVVIRAGETFAADASITNAYPIYEEGTYRVKALVYFPPLKRYFETQWSIITVSDGQPFWSEFIGVPTGLVGAGTYRKHELLFFNAGQRRRELYYRISEQSTGRVLKAYSLGTYLGVREAEKALDARNSLHVLHMNGPKAYSYTTIDATGKPEKQEFFFEDDDGGRPQLMKSGGEVVVRGGITEEEKLAPFDEDFRKISERPPGMPVPPPVKFR